ncbi:MAG: winged helix-turn-helix transcriptional regulator [Rhodocyclaceae bacterium]|nr:winged helix-turn-helix transcriptional regulator [Rhodocyclaceae bacterium]
MPRSANALYKHFTDTILQVFRANGQLIGWGDRFAAPFELTSARWQMLGALALAAQPLTAPQIASSMGVTRQGAQKQLNLLTEEGLAVRLANPHHKRSPFYLLTESGTALYRRIDDEWNRHVAEVSGAFSAEDLAITVRTLARINELHPLDDEGGEQ